MCHHAHAAAKEEFGGKLGFLEVLQWVDNQMLELMAEGLYPANYELDEVKRVYNRSFYRALEITQTSNAAALDGHFDFMFQQKGRK